MKKKNILPLTTTTTGAAGAAGAATNTNNNISSTTATEENKKQKYQYFCEKCNGKKILSCGIKSVTMNSLLKYIWRSSFEKKLENILTQHSHLLNITASIFDVQKQILEKQDTTSTSDTTATSTDDNDTNDTNGTNNNYIICSGWADMHQLDIIDSNGPHGSPESNDVSNALPIQNVLVILIQNYILLLNQPNNISNPNHINPKDIYTMTNKPIDIIHYYNVKRIVVSSNGHLLHLQHTITNYSKYGMKDDSICSSKMILLLRRINR